MRNLFLLVAVLVSGLLTAQATVYVNPSAATNGSGSQGSPFNDIPAAVDAAFNGGGGDVIITNGTHLLTSGLSITTAATAATAVTIKPETPYGVKIEFNSFSLFNFEEESSYLTLEGIEIDGNTDELRYWSIVTDDLWAANPNLGVRGGGIAVNVEGEHITIRNNYIHDAYQKGVEIPGGRYVVVEGNIISRIATTSLSGGHGVMRQQKGREFFTNDLPGVYRWDIRQNLLVNIEQRIYSWVATKGFMEMVIDEGKPILIDDPRDSQGIQEKMSARITDNIVAFGSVDHIRLKPTPGLEVSYNSVYAEGEKADGITNIIGDSDTPQFVDFRFIGNVARTVPWRQEERILSLECNLGIDQSTSTYMTYANNHTLADHENGTPMTTTATGAPAVIQNNVGFQGRIKPRDNSSVPGLEEVGSGEPFVDPLNGNFRINASAIPSGVDIAELGVRPATHDALDDRAADYGMVVERSDFIVDNRKLSQTIFDNIPNLLDGDDSNDDVFDGSGFFFDEHSGERTFNWPVVDGTWASTRGLNLNNKPNMEFRLNDKYLEWYEEMALNHKDPDDGLEYERYRLGESEVTQDQIFDEDWLMVSEITGDGENTVINAFNDVQGYNIQLAGDILIEFLDGYVPDEGQTFDLILAGTITAANPTAMRPGSNSLSAATDLFDRVLFEGYTPPDYSLTVESVGGQEALRLTILGVLPVELTSFTGEVIDKQNHLLRWETQFEETNDFFEVERSAEGGAWSAIGRVASVEEGINGGSYRFNDRAPLVGENLYRLRQVDLDGSFAFSEIIRLSSDLAQEMVIFPNPATDQFTVVTSASLKDLRLINPLGQNIASQVQISAIDQGFRISTAGLSTGVYLLEAGGVVRKVDVRK